MAKTFSQEEISQFVGGILTKNADGKINKVAPPLLADNDTLALALGEDEIENLAKTNAKCALVPLGVNFDHISTIEVERPRLAMMKLLNLFYEEPDSTIGVHPSAVIHPDAKIGKDVAIGPNVVVSRGAEIGDGTRLLANVYIGKFAVLGKNCLIHPGVNIGDFIKI